MQEKAEEAQVNYLTDWETRGNCYLALGTCLNVRGMC